MKFLDVPNSGSIQANTHSHNRAGQYKRNRRSPVQPIGTGRRSFIRAAFGAASQAWSGLTDAQRAAWASFALDHPVTDSLGQAIILTGHQQYVRTSISAQNVGEAAPAVPPADLSLPVVSDAVAVFAITTGLAVTFTGGDAGSFVVGAVSRPMSAGRSFNKTFWQPLGADGFADGFDAVWAISTALYAAEFGAPVVGQRVFIKLTPLSGGFWNGTSVIVSAIVTAGI